MLEIGFHLFPLVAVCSYAVALFVLIRDLSVADMRRPRRRFLVLGFVSHLAFLLLLPIRAATGPGLISFAETLAIISAALVAGVLFSRKLHERQGFLAAFVLPVALLFFLLSSVIFHVHRDVQQVSESNLVLWTHVVTAICGHVALALGCSVSVAIVLCDRFLKAKRIPSFMKKLPALSVLDELNGKLVHWAFFFMLLSMIVGISFGYLFEHSTFRFDSRVQWTGLVLLSLGVSLGLREAKGVRGRMSALLTIFSFLLVLCSFASLGFGGGGTFHVH